MKRVGTVPVLLLMCLVAPATALATPIAHLTLQSQPGDFIGEGGTFDITYNAPPDTIFAQIRRRLAGGSPAELLFLLAPPSPSIQFALLSFGTDQLGIPIAPGTYRNAERADFASPGHAGLDVSFQGLGANTVTGFFTILDVTFFADPVTGLQVATFSAQFEQHADGATPALFGTFQYSASGAAPVPEPGTLLLCLSGVGVSLWRRRRI
jgi:hypothetical protein